MDNQSEIRPAVYVIPANYIDSGRIVNGLFKTRNFVEAVIYALFMLLFLSSIRFSSTASKISWLIMLIGPGTLITLFGINDEPVSSFLMSVFRWRKNRRIMYYDRNAKLHEQRAADYILNRQLPRDKMEEMYVRWKKAREARLDEPEVLNYLNLEFTSNPLTESINRAARAKKHPQTTQDSPVAATTEEVFAPVALAVSSNEAESNPDDSVLRLDPDAFADIYDD